jgi:hypothetical protein
MERGGTDKPPIVRITRLEEHVSFGGRGKKFRIDPQRWIVYGVDAEGAERVYVEHTTKENHEAWLGTDPLWREAQRAIMNRLLGDPQTLEVVVRMAIGTALDRGNMDTATVLARHLSPETLRRLTT